MRVSEKYSHFTQLIQSNADALNLLSSIRSSRSNHLEDSILLSFLGAMNSIRQMAECYARMSQEDAGLLQRRIRIVEDQAISTVRALQMAVQFDYHDSDVKSQMETELFTRVERLTKNMRNPAEESFDIEKAETPHDLIRYFHQKGVDSMFDMSQFGENPHSAINVCLRNSGRLNVIDLEEKLKEKDLKSPETIRCKSLKAIVEFYNSAKAEEKNSGEDFKVLIADNRLMAQIKLGCHYSELDTQIGEGVGYIKFLFRDTDPHSYKNASNRTNYVRRILKKLGFKVTGEGKETVAVMERSSEEQAYIALMETLRLAASTKDLDLDNSCLDKYPNRAVNAFFEGVVNMSSYLGKQRGKDDKE